MLWLVTATAFSFVFARLRLETGSVWPAIALHVAWNVAIQAGFDPAATGARKSLWVGETGLLIALTVVVAAAIASRGRWTVVRIPPPREATAVPHAAVRVQPGGQPAAPERRTGTHTAIRPR